MWAPEGETRKWDCINDGQTDIGFFVIQISSDRLRAAYRCKTGVTTSKNPDGTVRRDWHGAWAWKYLLDRRLLPEIESVRAHP